MSIARWSVERPVAVTMRIASLVVLGAICLTKLPVDLLPKISIPTVAVNTSWPNVAPEDIETTITRPVGALTSCSLRRSSSSRDASSSPLQRLSGGSSEPRPQLPGAAHKHAALQFRPHDARF